MELGGLILIPGINSLIPFKSELESNEEFANGVDKADLAYKSMYLQYKKIHKTIQRKTYQTKYNLEIRNMKKREGKQLLFSRGP